MQKPLLLRIRERVRDRFLVAPVDEQVRSALIAHARFGPGRHGLRNGSVNLRDVVDSVQPRDLFDEILFDPNVEAPGRWGHAPVVRTAGDVHSKPVQQLTDEFCGNLVDQYMLYARVTQADRWLRGRIFDT